MWNKFVEAISLFFATSGVVFLKAIITFGIGMLLIKVILKAVAKMLVRAKVDKSARKFLVNAIKYTLYLLLIIAILSAIGVSITGFVAVLSALGLALSLALQGSLSNLANGIILVIMKPFKQGDVVAISSYEGVIKEIGIMHTIITGFDNKEISVPNKIVVENAISNGSVNATRKITYNFLVSYTSDVEKVKDIIKHVFSSTNLIHTSPEPFIAVEALEKNGIKFMAQCTINSSDYRVVYYSVLEEIFNLFKKQGIMLSHAQLEVFVNEKNEKNLPFRKEKALPQKLEKNISIPETKLGKDIMDEEELKELEKLASKNKTFKEAVKEVLKSNKSANTIKASNNATNNQDDDNDDTDNDDDDDNDGSGYEYLDLVNEIDVIEQVDSKNDGSINDSIKADNNNDYNPELEELFADKNNNNMGNQKEKKGGKNLFGFGKPKTASKSKVIIKKAK